MWDLIDHCLSFYFSCTRLFAVPFARHTVIHYEMLVFVIV